MAVRSVVALGRRALAVVGAVITIGVVTFGGVASAATELESTSPADLSTVAAPLTEIVIRFTEPTTMAEEGFEVLRTDGTVMEPIQIDTNDGTEYVMVFNPGLGPGTYGVRWTVVPAAGDPLTGAFQFDVEVPPTTTAAPTTTDPDATTVPTTTPASSTSAVPTTTTTVAVSTSVGSTVAPTTSPEFGELMAGETETSSVIPRLGHVLRFGGTIFAIGAIGALLWVLQSDKHDLFVVLNSVRMAGLVISVGAAMEWAAYADATGDGVGSLVETRSGVSALLASVGGVLVLFGLTERRSLEPVGLSFRWRPGWTSAAGLTGAVAVLASFGFDGHESARGPEVVLGIADAVHVTVAAIWAGGVSALALVAWLRRRRGQLARVSHAVVRFSPIAAASLVAVTLTGVVMWAMIVDDLGSPVGSGWGRTLMVKLVLVLMAVVAAGFNRFALGPAIEADPDSVDTARRIRFVLTVEVLIFAIVVIVTAVLVTLDTTTGV